MQDNYIIINKEILEKRIEELEKIEQELISLNMHYSTTRGKIDELISLLQPSNSIPLEGEIEKAHNVGANYGVYLQGGSYDHRDNIDSDEYINQLTLEI